MKILICEKCEWTIQNCKCATQKDVKKQDIEHAKAVDRYIEMVAGKTGKERTKAISNFRCGNF